MASGKIQSMGWSPNEALSNVTYGGLIGTINQSLKLGFIRWSGNATSPPGGLLTFALPAKYKPKI